MQQLNNTNNASPLCVSLEEFRHCFTELSNREKFFNPYHLLRAYEAYIAFFDRPFGESREFPFFEKERLFLRKIVGYIQRFVPACYAQAFVQGLPYYNDHEIAWRPKALKRSLQFSAHGYCFAYFSAFSSDKIYHDLGFKCFIGFASYAGTEKVGGPDYAEFVIPEERSNEKNSLSALIKYKQNAFRILCNKHQESCVRP